MWAKQKQQTEQVKWETKQVKAKQVEQTKHKADNSSNFEALKTLMI